MRAISLVIMWQWLGLEHELGLSRLRCRRDKRRKGNRMKKVLQVKKNGKYRLDNDELVSRVKRKLGA
jgi:hypothetical protein